MLFYFDGCPFLIDGPSSHHFIPSGAVYAKKKLDRFALSNLLLGRAASRFYPLYYDFIFQVPEESICRLEVLEEEEK
jgi:hypothetical protein